MKKDFELKKGMKLHDGVFQRILTVHRITSFEVCLVANHGTKVIYPKNYFEHCFKRGDFEYLPEIAWGMIVRSKHSTAEFTICKFEEDDVTPTSGRIILKAEIPTMAPLVMYGTDLEELIKVGQYTIVE